MSEKDNSHFIRLINMYHSAQINEKLFTGSHMEIEKGSCRITLPLQESYYHAMQAVHGSVYFKLLDDAAFFAVQSEVTDRFVVTASFNIHLIRPVSSGTLRAEGSVQFQSRNLIVAESRVYDARGREIGFGTGNFMPSRAMLTDASGYSD